MDLTVGKIKEIIKDLPDDVILANLQFGNDSFETFEGVKRVMLMKRDEELYLVINKMGSHFTGEGQQKGVTYEKRYWD